MEMGENYFELQKQKRRHYLLSSVDFYKKINSFYELIDRLSQQNFESIKYINNKKRIICPSLGMNATLYSLKGIISLCELGDVVDAFILLRKIRDNLYLDLFFISESLNNKPNNYELSKSISEMSQEEMMDELVRYISIALDEEEKNKNIQNIGNWFNNEYSLRDDTKHKASCFSFGAYKRNIENKYKTIKECHELYLNKLFEDLNNGLNNYVHSNGPSFISNDTLNMNNDLFISAIKDLLKFINLIKRVFLIDLYFIDATLFKTDDYVDTLEMGMKPVEGSQYEAIYQVVEEFEDIAKDDSDLYSYLKNNNKLLMKCFYDNN